MVHEHDFGTPWIQTGTLERGDIDTIPIPATPRKGDTGSITGYVPESRAEFEVTTTILLPAYNEAQALPAVLNDLLRVVDDTYEILVVDDGSTDGTAAVASEYPCRLIIQESNQGKGAAVRTGLTHAQGRYVVVMDADNTYPAESIPDLVHLLGEHDFVRGIREQDAKNSPLVNRMGNKAFDSVLKIVYGLEGGDHLSGLYGLRRDVFQSMNFIADGFDLEVEIGIKARAHELRTAWFPIEYKERIGEKKLNPIKDGWRILQRIMALTLLYNPGRMFILPAVCLLALSVVFTFLLRGGPVVVPVLQLSLYSFVTTTIGLAVSFQVVVYGLVAALYAVEKGVKPKQWLLKLSGRRMRLSVLSVGTIATVAGVIILADQVAKWTTPGGSTVTVEGLVLAGVLLLCGLQTVLAVMFLSIFASKLDKVTKKSPRTARARLLTHRLRRARS
ncbi:MAG: glycosyltransferase family 2 protein [Chloroflexota bacterium]